MRVCTARYRASSRIAHGTRPIVPFALLHSSALMAWPPPIKLHRHSGQYRTFIDGAYVYLGRDEDKAKDQYRLLISRSDSPHRGTIAELCRHALEWAETEYKRSGRWRGEAPTIMYALRFLDRTVTVQTPNGPSTVYLPALPADQFNVTHLAQVQRAMIDAKKSRSYINGQIRRIVKVFVRGRIDGLVSAHTVQDLQLLRPVRRGHPTVHETGRVYSVDDATIEATLPALSPLMRTIVKVLRNDGMRVGELMPTRLDMLDLKAKTSNLGTEHKTGERRFPKVLRFSDESWGLLLPYIEAAKATMVTTAYLFPSELNPTGFVQPDSVRCAIREACIVRGVKPHWFTHQLRHAKATELARQERRRIEREALKRVAEQLGHRSESSARGYVDPLTG